jgi:hypothetical protein
VLWLYGENAVAGIETSFCSELSRVLDEPMVGTALRVDVWLLLEYRGPWGRLAFEESSLDQAVKDHLSGALAAIPNARLQFIKQDRLNSQDSIAFYVAVSSTQLPHLYALQLDSYDDLLEMDIPSIASGGGGENTLQPDLLFLICTNGKRDQCCARYGTPLYQQAKAEHGDSVWQSSHVGTHRFAPNMIALPHGIYYGRVESGEAATIIEKTRAGQLHLDNYRGRSSYSAMQQAGEFLLRSQTGDMKLDAYRLN